MTQHVGPIVPSQWLEWSSPWAPLAIATILAFGKPAGVYQLDYQAWIRWHHGFRIKGEGVKLVSAEEAIDHAAHIATLLAPPPPPRAEAA